MSGVFNGGGLDAAIAAYGGKREDWLDLSTGINPNPYPLPSISPDAWARLPDKDAERALLIAARNCYEVPKSCEIVAAPGTQALIQQLPGVIPAREVSIVSPTYGEHERVWQRAGAVVNKDTDLTATAQTRVVCNPNNPDCRVYDPGHLSELAAKGQFLIVDEAFCDAVPEISVVPHLGQNTIVLKSFGKFFGLAGMRLGFAICEPKIADRLREALGPWPVSGPALSIAAQALKDRTWIANTRQMLARKCGAMASILQRNGLHIKGENPLFIYTHHQSATALHEHLAQCRILVRPFPERPGFLRFGLCRDEEELHRLDAALRSFSDV